MGVIKKKTVTRGTEGGLKYICDICAVDITSTVRIQCAEKEVCPDYDLCVQCFAQGATSKNHVPQSHKYHVIEQHSIPVYDKDWGADEELLMLEGCETYGLGSWADIADHIGGYRSKDEVRDHYIDTYVNSPNFPLPALADPKDMTLLEEMPREKFQARKKRRIEERKEAAKNAPPAPPKQKPTASVPACHEVQGYMPGRLEFETEFNNEAEEAVQHMQFEPGDGINPRTGEIEPEMELKMAVMDIYNSKLTARAFRKRAIFEHKLLEYRKNAAIDKKRTKDERELVQKVKPFARILNHDEWEAFSDGLLREQWLRAAVHSLQEWRTKGIAEIKKGLVYDAEKASRNQKAPSMAGAFDRLPGARPPKPPPPAEVSAQHSALLAHDLGGEWKDKQRPESYWRMVQEKKKAKDDEAAAASGTGNVLANGNGNAKHQQLDLGMSMNFGAKQERDDKDKYSPAPVPGVAPMKFAPDTDGLQLLNKEEKELCVVIRSHPKAYLAMKDALLKEAIKQGGTLKRKTVKEICKIDNSKASRLFEFLVRSGWVQKA